MLDAKATFSPYPDCDAVAVVTPASDDTAPPADTTEAGDQARRPVTPRRLLRLTSPRLADGGPLASVTTPNIFSGLFDGEDALTDSRLQRSRARMRHLLAAHEAGLSAAERNLWHDDPVFASAPAADPPQPAAASHLPPAAADRGPTGRRIRHLKATDIARPPRSAVNDPLHTRLALVREALYAPDADAPAPVATLSVPARLTVQVLNLILMVIALPVGLAIAALTFWRGESLRLSAGAITATGLILAWAPLPTFPFL